MVTDWATSDPWIALSKVDAPGWTACDDTSMPAHTGPSRRARPVGIAADPLRGENPHALVIVRTPRGWKAWCFCSPGRTSLVRPSPSAATTEVVRNHPRVGEGVGLFPLVLVNRHDDAGTLWRTICECGWRGRWFDHQSQAEEQGVVHWVRARHGAPAERDSTAGAGGSVSSKRSSYFRARVSKTEDGWRLETKTGRPIVAIVDIPDQVWPKLSGALLEFRIVSELGDGTPVVEPFFSNRGALATQIEADLARWRRPSAKAQRSGR